MPRKNERTAPPAATEWKGFLERRLSDDELAVLDEWEAAPEDVLAALGDIVEAGYKVTLTYSKERATATCTMQDQRPGKSTQGYAISSQDGDCWSALKMAVYKHASVLQADWSQLLGQGPATRRG